ncbi:hypothetical protein [Rhodococcus sp. (in: high G+C Gram-positive bacteria)]|uniref:hypothetical protein n=1 Tax=Rhodococcus sp. TaxID=1831 RepID=UPI003B8A70C2
MSRNVPCPDATSSHGQHEEGSLEYRKCSENERQRMLRLRDSGIVRLLAEQRDAGIEHLLAEEREPADDSPTFGMVAELTPIQKLAAAINQTAPKDKSDGPTFGG